MSVRLYTDVHIPFAVVQALRLRGVDVLTPQEDETDRFSDSALLDRATVLQCVLFSQDRHLLREAAFRHRSGTTFSGVIYAHQLNITVGRCVEDLEAIALASEPEEWVNRVEYLPL